MTRRLRIQLVLGAFEAVILTIKPTTRLRSLKARMLPFLLCLPHCAAHRRYFLLLIPMYIVGL